MKKTSNNNGRENKKETGKKPEGKRKYHFIYFSLSFLKKNKMEDKEKNYK